ncbi:hypothetical protein [Cohnella sp. GCM10027633]|uniref:hypothetical protein n=1 Tax=unclassified Cohnella TaxID=2636738 RepID=UPI0036403702
MSQIRIDVNGVQTEHRSFKSAYRKIKDEEQQLSTTRQRIDGRISARRSLDSRLSRAGSRLMRVENQLEALYDFIEHGLQSYIQADDKAKEHPFENKKKKSIWDKIGDGLQAAAHGVTGFMEGTAEAVIGTVEGLWTMVTHPIETVQGLVYVVKHPLQTAQGIWKAVSDSWTNEVVNGDADSRGRWFGRMIGEVALSVVGTKGVDKVAKLAKGTRLVREGRGVRIVRVDGPERVQGQPDSPDLPKPDGDTQSRISTEVHVPPNRNREGEGTGNVIDGLEVIDGKVLGKIPLDEFTRIRIESIANPNADSIVLGKYTPTFQNDVANWTIPGPDSYVSRAGGESSYFSLGSDWDKIKKTYELMDKDMFKLFNVPALDDAVLSGKTIKFSHDPSLEIYEGSALADEWIYLQMKFGFSRLNQIGGFWIAK